MVYKMEIGFIDDNDDEAKVVITIDELKRLLDTIKVEKRRNRNLSTPAETITIEIPNGKKIDFGERKIYPIQIDYGIGKGWYVFSKDWKTKDKNYSYLFVNQSTQYPCKACEEKPKQERQKSKTKPSKSSSSKQKRDKSGKFKK